MTFTVWRNIVESQMRVVTDLVGYIGGGSFDVDMISATSDAGQSVIFGITLPVLEQARSAQWASPENDLCIAVFRDIAAQLVLANFREAIRSPIDTGFFCYRAVEAMMQSMKADPIDKDAPAWEMLRDRLQISRSAIDEIKKHSEYPRHGKIASISAADRGKVFRLTDQMIKRYLEYLRRGKAPLFSSEFPSLTYLYWTDQTSKTGSARRSSRPADDAWRSRRGPDPIVCLVQGMPPSGGTRSAERAARYGAAITVP